MYNLSGASLWDQTHHVQYGYQSCAEQIMRCLVDCVPNDADLKLAGHSRGGGIASVLGLLIDRTKLHWTWHGVAFGPAPSMVQGLSKQD